MRYINLGANGPRVSAVGLGTMTWGQQNNESEAFAQMDFAKSRGINLFDAAELYPVPPRPETYGLTERYIGNWLAYRGRRDEVVLATKVIGRSTGLNTPHAAYIRGGSNLNRDNIRRAVEGSLLRLRTDYLDLYQVHWPERDCNVFGKRGYLHNPKNDGVTILETLEALGELVNEGLVKYVGISNETSWGLMEYLRCSDKHHLPRIVSLQNPYNLLTRQYEIGLAEMSLRESVGLLAYSPMAFGVLSGKYLHKNMPENSRLALFKRFSRYSSASVYSATEAYAEIARKHGLSLAQMSLAFVLQQPFLGSCLIGATSIRQLQENIDAHSVSLSAEILRDIEEVYSCYPDPAV